MKDKLFRTRLFGGYRRDDVQTYITRLEEELTKIQAQIQGSQFSSMPPKQQKTEEIEKDIVILDDNDGEHEKAETGTPETRQEPAAEEIVELAISVEQQKELAETRLELEKVKRDLREVKTQLAASNQNCERSESKLKLISIEKRRLEDEVEQLRQEKHNYEKDYNAIKEVLLNAKVNAEIIMTRARKEADLLLENTQRQITEQKKESVTELMHHLTENYNGLQISRHYMEEQARNIDRMERQIKSIQNKMESFLEAGADKQKNSSDKS